jgi:hypothetical protein
MKNFKTFLEGNPRAKMDARKYKAQNTLSSAEYQAAKKLSVFSDKHWKWDGNTQLYNKVV